MPDRLPKGWVKTTLGEIVRPGRRRVLPGEHPELPYIGLEHIESKSMRLLGKGNAGDVRSSSILFEKGDVLYGKMRPYLNKVWVAEFAGMCSAEFLVFSHTEELNSAFLALRLNADDFVHFANQQVSGERPRAGFKGLSSFPIHLPPLAEQGRIMAKLNESFTRMHASESAAKQGSERLAKYRSAVLHAAVTGELTRGWRQTHRPDEPGAQLLQRILKARRARWEEAELQRFRAAGKVPEDDKWKLRYREPIELDSSNRPVLPKGWTWMSLDQLTVHLASGSREWANYYDKGSGTFLMAQNVRRTGLDLSFRQAVDPPANDRDRDRSRVAKDDILVTIVGANVGDVCVVPKELPEHFVCQSVALIRLAEPRFSRFVWLYLAADEDGQKQWRNMIYGAGRPHLGFAHLRVTAVPVPPRAEQTTIVAEVERRLAAADRLATALNRQLDYARATRQSLLREAFAGRLVPQDPKDEPASVLPDRIRAAREAPTLKHMPKAKKRITRRPLREVLREHKKPITPEELFRASGYQAEFNESDEPQAVVDAFYGELRKLTDKPPKVSEEKNSKHEVLLRAFP